MVIKAHCCLMFVTGCDSYMNLVGLGFLWLFPPLHNKIPSVLDQVFFLFITTSVKTQGHLLLLYFRNMKIVLLLMSSSYSSWAKMTVLCH